jgi:Mce-associated membrane protein
MTDRDGRASVSVRTDGIAVLAEKPEVCDEPEAGELDAAGVEPVEPRRSRRRLWGRVVAFGILPALAILLASGAGYLKWLDASARASQVAAAQSVQAATEDTIAMLSYHPDTAEKDLTAARDRLTGSFRDSYTRLINEVVISGAKEKQISAVATVPAAASVSATENHSVVVLFVNQTTNIGDDPPSATASSVRVTLDKVDERWLVSQFEPI